MPKLLFWRKPRSIRKITLFGSSYSIRTFRGLFGKRPPRDYINKWYINAWLSVNSVLLASAALVVSPPSNARRPHVPRFEDVKEGMGYSISETIYSTLVVAYLVDFGLFFVLAESQTHDLWIILACFIAMYLIVWFVQYRRHLDYYVVTNNKLTKHYGFYNNADFDTYEGDSIEGVTFTPSNNNLFWKWVGVCDLTIRFKDGRAPVVIKRVGSGEQVQKLIEDMHLSIEVTQKQFAANQKEALVTDKEIHYELVTMNSKFDGAGKLSNRQILMLKVIIRVLAQGGKAFTKYGNLQLEESRKQTEYLRRIADHLAPLPKAETGQTGPLPTIKPITGILPVTEQKDGTDKDKS